MNLEETTIHWVEIAAMAIGVLAATIIVIAVVYSTVRFLVQIIVHRERREKDYKAFRERLAKALMLGLELLVAADIIETVALETTLETVTVLGLLVLIRILLSWSLTVETEGRWPWQPERKENGKKVQEI